MQRRLQPVKSKARLCQRQIINLDYLCGSEQISTHQPNQLVSITNHLALTFLMKLYSSHSFPQSCYDSCNRPLKCIPQIQHIKFEKLQGDLLSHTDTLFFVKVGNARSSALKASSTIHPLYSVSTAFCLLLLTSQLGTDNMMLILQAEGLASCFSVSKTKSPLWIGQQDTGV